MLIRLADELHESCDISDALWDDLRGVFSEPAIMELILLAGFYRTVSYIAKGLRLPLEPGRGRRFPEAAQ